MFLLFAIDLLPFIFLFGLFFGSFLGVLATRIPISEPFIKNRSRCDSCKKNLKWYDLIPLFSFLLLQGKCRYCRKRISFDHLLVELVTGVLFTFTFLHVGLRPELLYYLFIISSFIVIFFIDFKHKIIPNLIVYPAIIVSLGYLILNTNYLVPQLLAAVGAFLFFLLLFLITKGRGMGFGDVQLSVLLGLFLGFPHIVLAIYIAFLTGALISLILLVSRKFSLKDSVPFGPFLVFGTLIAFYFGDYILSYVNFL